MKWNPYEPPPIPAAVLKTIMAVTSRHGKHYCRVGQEKILILLKKFHGIDICRSTLCAWMKWLKEKGYIRAYQGTHRNHYGKVIFGPNRYYLLAKALNWLNSLVGWCEKVYRLLRVRPIRHNEDTPFRNLRGYGVFSRVQSLKDELNGVPLPMS